MKSHARAELHSRFTVIARNVEGRGGVFHGQAGKVAQLDDARLARIHFREPFERVVEGGRLWTLPCRRRLSRPARLAPAAAALGGLPLARGVDQNAPHHL